MKKFAAKISLTVEAESLEDAQKKFGLIALLLDVNNDDILNIKHDEVVELKGAEILRF